MLVRFSLSLEGSQSFLTTLPQILRKLRILRVRIRGLDCPHRHQVLPFEFARERLYHWRRGRECACVCALEWLHASKTKELEPYDAERKSADEIMCSVF